MPLTERSDDVSSETAHKACRKGKLDAAGKCPMRCASLRRPVTFSQRTLRFQRFQRLHQRVPMHSSTSCALRMVTARVEAR